MNTYAHPKGLISHIRIFHEGIKPYNCSECEKSFSMKKGLKNHIEKIHDGKGTIIASSISRFPDNTRAPKTYLKYSSEESYQQGKTFQ